MGLACIIIEKAVQHKDVVAKGAMAGGAFVLGAAGMHVIDKKKADKIIQEEKKISLEYGVKKGKEIATARMRQTFIDPVLARVSLAFYIAQIDGYISKEEKEKLEQLTNSILENQELPDVVKREVKKIALDKNMDFEKVKVYLDRISIENLEHFMKEVYIIAEVDGINEDEEKGILLLEDYILSRNTESSDDWKARINLYGNSAIDIYCDNFISKKDVQAIVDEYSFKMKMLDQVFSTKTKLNKTEIGLLMTATALQCMRIYLVNYIATIEKAGAKNVKENFLHKQQERVLKHLDKGSVEKATKYYAPLNQIIFTPGVPYDTTKYGNEKLGLFKGANHRFATLGHDPVIGLVVGTCNIMTNTITTVNENSPVPLTHHVKYDLNMKHPAIYEEASLIVALRKSLERMNEGMEPFVAAFLKQLIHIATDVYTPAGIQLPGASLVLDKQTVEVLTSYVSTGDAVKFGASLGIEMMINKMIELIHACTLLEKGETLEKQIHQIKTRKIILYSNAIATGSNVIKECITGQYQNLDWAGMMSVIRKVFSDVDFIYDVKREFIRSGLGEK